MIYPSHLLLVTVGAAFGFSLVNAWGSNRQAQVLLDPGTNEQPASLALNVDLPPIAPLVHYYGTEGDSWARFNPFIPLENRLAEERQLRQPRPQRVATTNIPVPRRTPRPSEPPPEQPTIAPLDLSTRQPPVVVGGFMRNADPVIVIGDGQSLQVLGEGDVVGEWTLRRIAGNSAWFTWAEESAETRVAIGMSQGDTVMGGTAPAAATGNTSAGGQGIDLNAYLAENPELQRMVRDNPEAAQAMLEQILGDLNP